MTFAMWLFNHRIYRQIADTALVFSFLIFALSLVFFMLIEIDAPTTGSLRWVLLREMGWAGALVSKYSVDATLYSFFVFLASIIMQIPTAFINESRKIQPQDYGVNWRRDGF